MQNKLIVCLFVIFGFIGGANAEQINAGRLAEKYLIVTRQKQMNVKMLEMVQVQMSQNIYRAIRERNLTGAQRDLANVMHQK